MKLRHAVALLLLVLVVREIAYSEIKIPKEPCVQKLVGYIHRCEVKPSGQGLCYVQFPDGTYGWVKQPTEFAKTAEYCP